MAERVGFEPTVGFPLHSLSRRALSTAQTPLRGFCNRNRRFVCAAMYPFGCDIPDQILGLRLRPKFLRDALRVYLRAAKNDCRIAAHSFARMPATTSTR
jgi:hypothetical protein